MALCAMSMGAETLTVYDEQITSNYVPIYGYFADNYLKCEFVIPATELQAMDGNSISKLTWYLSSPADKSFGDAHFQIFLKEVEGTTLNAYQGQEGAALVYEGDIDATQSELTITFTEPYEYHGGNLLIGTYNTVKGDYSTTVFFGATVEGASVQGYSGSSLDAVVTNQRNFIPKTTFEYEPTVLLDYDARVTPNELNFGKVNPGQTSTVNVTLKNRGANAFTPAITLEAPFSTAYQPAELAAGESVEIPVTFAPTAVGDFAGTMTIAYGGEAPLTVAMTGLCVNEVELTVADGTVGNGYYPIYGYYYDTPGTLSQMIYPADMFAELAGSRILGLKFFAKYEQTIEGGELQVSLGETEQTVYTENDTEVEGKIVNGLTPVMTAPLVAGGTELVLNFDTPYTYNGGNLVVETLAQTGGNFPRQDFVGMETEGLTSYNEYSYWGDIYNRADKFLPKMTVIYAVEEPVVETYTVNGYVMDGEGEALEGVAVTMTVTMPAEGAPRRNASEPVTYTATTDATGNFSIEMTPVDGAAYTLAFVKDGYKDQTIDYNLDDEVRVYMQRDEATGVDNIEAAQDGKVIYVNPMGQTSDRPFQGVNIMVQGGKTIGKIVR
ncbi:MAG: choice-of-anchor D domain-containing protein [Muribaculaceae bacterium]|nr:choice-of-anchor D domain-containing protein [Muribaculaceae bacterium]